MPAGRPRKPTNVLALNGTLKAHPEKARARANEPTDMGPFPEQPPDYLSVYEKKVWHELVGLCHKGSLTASDAWVVEMGARAMAKLRKDKIYNDHKTMIRLESVLGRLGLTPADRSRIQVIKPKAAGVDPEDEFARSA